MSILFNDHSNTRELSTYYESPINFRLIDGSLEVFPTAHHLYEAHRYLDNPDAMRKIAQLKTPEESRKLAQSLKEQVKYDDKKWTNNKSIYLNEILALKFTQHPNLKDVLLNTGKNKLYYANVDPFLGTSTDGKGLNILGLSLMRLRDNWDLIINDGSDINQTTIIEDDKWIDHLEESETDIDRARNYLVAPFKINDDVEERLIIGLGEKHKYVGKVKGEIIKDQSKWKDLNDRSNYNWRKVLDDEFSGDYKRGPTSFILDDKEWKTVTHYILGQIYKNIPDYSNLFSLNFRDNPNGYWGNVDSAKDAHIKNAISKYYEMDPEFHSKHRFYFYNAYLAKFTQNFNAKKYLLLTGNATLSSRMSDGRYKNLSLLMEVRDNIRENPNVEYFGPGNIKIVENSLATIKFSTELNTGIVGIPRPINKTFKYVEPKDESCVIYMAMGVYNTDVASLASTYDISYVNRHVFAIERITYDANEKLLIGLQRTPTSIRKNYVVFSDDDKSIYFEMFESGFGVFIISDKVDNNVLNVLKQLISL